MRNLTLPLILLLWLAAPAARAAEGCIVMIPDIGRPQASLDYAAQYLATKGYEVHIAPLPIQTDKQHYTLEGIANHDLAPFIEEACAFYKPRVDFVTYGLGAMVLNQYMFDHDIVNLGRVVMVEPPVYNKQMMEEIHTQHPLYQQYIRNYTNRSKLEPRLRVKVSRMWEIPVGVVAYDESLGYKYGEKKSQKENEEKKISRDLFVPGMQDEVYLKASPELIMHNEAAMQNAVYFLRNGTFDHGEEE
ncbi:MAG: hypothetical protein EB060_02355 [Proteobacteria bacterium]|nr:hypothetical protein [Pseudomonadota bacterium]